MSRGPDLRPRALRASVRTALAEDRVDRDRTTRALLPRSLLAEGLVSSQARGILSGMAAARAIARESGLRVRRAMKDGAPIRPGSVVLVVRGDARRILGAERTLLNFLMHASGVATATARAVRAAGGVGSLEVWATRKTLPGLRDLEKAAVRHGGGRPHRRDLALGLLIKNNHLALVPLEEAIRRARRRARPGERVEVEVRSIAQAVRAARAGADALLLDNQRPAAARAIVRALARRGLRNGRWIELSGGISPATVGRYRGAGADAASLGALTHSAPAVPFHLEVRPAALRRRGA
jgi:nicotinate-nucleotide pyrophosphorylase (carboxylating)